MSLILKYDLREGLEDLSGNGHDSIGTLDYCYDEWVRCLINTVDAPSFFENDNFRVKFKISDIKHTDKPQFICSNFSNAIFLNWAFYYEKSRLHFCIFEKFHVIPLDPNIKELTVDFQKKGKDIIIDADGSHAVFMSKTEDKQEDTFTLYIDLGHSSYDIVKLFDCEPCKSFIEYLEIYSGEL